MEQSKPHVSADLIVKEQVSKILPANHFCLLS